MKRNLIALIIMLGVSQMVGCSSRIADTEYADFLRKQGLDGKIVLIEFGQVGCEISHEGLLTMQRMQAEQEIPDLNYLRVEASEESEPFTIYFAENASTIPVYYDPSTDVAKSFEATAYPNFVLIGKSGRVRYRGGFPPDKLANWVKALSEEKRDPGADVALFGADSLNIPELLTSTKLPDTSGTEPQPLADYLGKNGLMLLFVDTECPFAGEAMSQTPVIAQTLAQHEIPVVLINIDQDEKIVAKFYAEKQIGTAVVYDTTDVTHVKWNVSSVPTVVLISSSQEILYKGPAVWQKVASALEASLGLEANSISFSEHGTEYG